MSLSVKNLCASFVSLSVKHLYESCVCRYQLNISMGVVCVSLFFKQLYESCVCRYLLNICMRVVCHYLLNVCMRVACVC